MTERHLVGEAVFDFNFNSQDITHEQEAALTPFARDKLLEIADEVFNEVSGSETIRIEQLEIDLGDITLHNFQEEASARFREKLRTILLEKIMALPEAPESWEGRFSKGRIQFEQLQRFFQDGIIPERTDISAMDDLLAQAMRRDKEALLDFLRHTARRDIVIQRLSRQFAPHLLEELLNLLAPAQAGQLSKLLVEIQESNDADTSARIIAELLYQRLQPDTAGQDAHRLISSSLAGDKSISQSPTQAADNTGQGGMLKARLEAALLEGTPQSIADIWDALLLHHADLVRAVFRQRLGDTAVQEKLANRFPEPMLQELVSLLAPSGRDFIAALLDQPELHATQESSGINLAAWQHTLTYLHANAGHNFDRDDYASYLLLQLAGQGRDTGAMLLALSRVDAELGHASLAADSQGNSKPSQHDAKFNPVLSIHPESASRGQLADLTRGRMMPPQPAVARTQQDDVQPPQSGHPASLPRPAEHAEAQPGTPLTATGLMRARLQAAMTTGQASELAGIWPALLAQHAELVREVFLGRMAEARFREKMLQGWPAPMLRELLQLLAPQQADVVLRLMTLPGLQDEAGIGAITTWLWRYTIAYLHIAVSAEWRWENYAAGLLSTLIARGTKQEALQHIQEVVTQALVSAEPVSAHTPRHALLLQQVQLRLGGIDREYERLDELDELVRVNPHAIVQLYLQAQKGGSRSDLTALTLDEARTHVEAWLALMPGKTNGKLRHEIHLHAIHARDRLLFYRQILDSLLHQQGADSATILARAGIAQPASSSVPPASFNEPPTTGTPPDDRRSELLQHLRQRLAGATQEDATEALAELERNYPDTMQHLLQHIHSGELKVLPEYLNAQECRSLLQALCNRQTGSHGFAHIVEPFAMHATEQTQYYRNLLSRILKHEPIDLGAVTTAMAGVPQAMTAAPAPNPSLAAIETKLANTNASARLRSRLAAAITSGKADSISDLWPELAGRHTDLLKEEFLKWMGAAVIQKQVAQGWPEASRLTLIWALMPQQYPVIARLVLEPEFAPPVSTLFWQHMLACLHDALATGAEWETGISRLVGLLEKNGIAPELIQRVQEKLRAYSSGTGEGPRPSRTTSFSVQRSTELQQQLFERLTGHRRDKDYLSPLIELVQHDAQAVSQLYLRLQNNKALLDLAGLGLSEARMHIQIWFTQFSKQAAAEMLYEIKKHASGAQNPLGYYQHVLGKLLRGEVVDIEQAIASSHKPEAHPGTLGNLPAQPAQPRTRHEQLLEHLLARFSGQAHEDASDIIAELGREHSAEFHWLLRKIQAGSVSAKPEHLNLQECKLLVEAFSSPQETFRQAVAHYAARTADQERYYRQLLSYLLRNEPVDLEAAAHDPAAIMRSPGTLPESTSLHTAATSATLLPQIPDRHEEREKAQQSQVDSHLQTPAAIAVAAATGHAMESAMPSRAAALSRLLLGQLRGQGKAGHATFAAALAELVRDFPADWAKLQRTLQTGAIPVATGSLTAEEAAQLVKAMTVTRGQVAELQVAIAEYARKAHNPEYFYRSILDSLLRQQPIDLESAAGLSPASSNELPPAETPLDDRRSELLQHLRQRLAGAKQADASEALAELERNYPDAMQNLLQHIQSGETRLQSQALSIRESRYVVRALVRHQSNGFGEEFLHAIELHAARAANPQEYYRRVLDDLALDRPVDLETAANSPSQETPQASTPVLPAQMDAERPIPQSGQGKGRSEEEDILPREGEEIYISNAGMILMAPYLPQLFKQLALLEEGRFKSRTELERGIHLLQFAINESCDSPEFLLALNKILCGLDLAQPIVRAIQPQPLETETIEGLLAAMIRNWKIIGSTSIQGLRESFLQRAGRLQFKDGNWHLKVESKGIDVLLDQLPWSFSIIRHPWMKQAVYVEWR